MMMVSKTGQQLRLRQALIIKKKQQIFFILIICVLVSNCASRRNKNISTTSDFPKTSTSQFLMTEYQGQESGTKLPSWVSDYFYGGLNQIEKQDQYKSTYCFIAEQTSKTLSTLNQWQGSFVVRQDMPMMVFMRVYNRLTQGLSAHPGYVYGKYFEEILTLASSTIYEDAEIKEVFWVRGRDLKANEDVYKMLILCVIDKNNFTNQFSKIMNSINVTPKYYTRNEIIAVNRMRNNFWQEF
ncbi:MAG: hypothetical protein Ta2G_12440 [Termitinemataceae bacterium]|nr:MAG: hypothetical protein Ta2G_12440 [Termitinemataceae bacterium]